jgi:hypothetical protein
MKSKGLMRDWFTRAAIIALVIFGLLADAFIVFSSGRVPPKASRGSSTATIGFPMVPMPRVLLGEVFDGGAVSFSPIVSERLTEYGGAK